MRMTVLLVLLGILVRFGHAWTMIFNPKPVPCRLSSTTLASTKTTPQSKEQRQRRRIYLASRGREATLLSRSLEITSDWAITVWEWENPAQVVESYWEAQQRQIMEGGGAYVDSSDDRVLDPFGLVTWPGSVVAAQELKQHSAFLKDKTVLILGAGVGVEAQAAATLGATKVIATDIHPTTLQQLELGIQENSDISNKEIVTTEILDVFEETNPLPNADLLVVADVLYNEQLATQVCKRIVQAYQRDDKIRVLVTDSQRFVDFPSRLNCTFQSVGINANDLVDWKENTFQFTGSGVCIDEDQTYDVNVRTLWIGLP